MVDDPPDGIALRGTCVMAHALFARKTEFGRRDRAGLAQAYAAAGWRTIAFDFRGHGESTLPRATRDWGYLLGSWRQASSGVSSGFWFTPYRFWAEPRNALGSVTCVDM